MSHNHRTEKRHFAVLAQQKRQEERQARKISDDLDSKYKLMETKLEEASEKAAGLTDVLENVIESNKKLVESVLHLMDTAKLKQGPNTTKRKLEKLESKYGKRK